MLPTVNVNMNIHPQHGKQEIDSVCNVLFACLLLQDMKTKILVALRSMRVSSPHQIQDFGIRICAFSCLFLPLKLPRTAGSSYSASSSSVPSLLYPPSICPFLPIHMHKQIPKYLSQNLPMKDRGLSTRNDPEGRKANHLLPKPSTSMTTRALSAFRLFLW